MREDITYCVNKKCPRKKCERHISNIKQKNIPHSFAEFDCIVHRARVFGTLKNGDSE